MERLPPTRLETHVCQKLRVLLEGSDDWAIEDSPRLRILLGELELEIVGTAILISDQAETPVRVRLRLDPGANELSKLLCNVGEVDGATGELVRVAFGSSKSLSLRADLPDRVGEVSWMYTVELGEDATAECNIIATCDECGSLHFEGRSAMTGLCPECAHQLHGYERCDHEFRGSRCAKCFWDGSIST